MDARTLKRIKDAESRPLSHPEARAIVLHYKRMRWLA